MTNIPQCQECQHFHEKNLKINTCDAYAPEAIPWEIINGEVIHDKPYKQKNEIVFETK